ncbi:uncharacterized protein [Amphiura filiformis]|uniref:uncharacterized protein n=1 Tax=Amphiura filiformis TaxID=82378 RepID=UPI003B21662F
MNDERRYQDFCAQVRMLIAASTGVPETAIRACNLGCGSIEVSMSVVDDGTNDANLDEVTDNIQKQIDNNEMLIVVDGRVYAPIEGEPIVVEDTTPGRDSGSETTKIVIAVVVCIIVVALIIAFTVCYLKKRNGGKDSERGDVQMQQSHDNKGYK